MDCSTCSEIVNAEFYLGFISGLYHPMHTLRPWRQFTTGAPAALTQPSIASNIAKPLAALQGLESPTLGPSTFHLFRDLFEILTQQRITIPDYVEPSASIELGMDNTTSEYIRRRIISKNKVQFQKGLSLTDFMAQYGDDRQCRSFVFQVRWPKEFCCPECGYEKYCEIRNRNCFQCNRCHYQTSLLSGTIYEQTKLPLSKWFLASYLLTQNKSGLSALTLSRQVGVSYNTAWSVKHKLMQVMLERERSQPLSGRVEIDDAYWGGEKQGGKRGRGSENKTPFVAAVETTEEGQPVRMKMHKVKGLRKEEIKHWGQQQLEKDSHVVTDGLWAFKGLQDAGIKHEAIVTGGGRKSVELLAFHWTNTLLGNVKSALQGIYHAIQSKHLPRYLAEFEYRFNRRFKLDAIVPRLIHASVQTPPMPGHLLKLAEASW